MDDVNIGKKPEICVFAGPNGSGKSTYTTDRWVVGQYINADDIKIQCQLSDLEAAQEATRRREDALANQEDFTFETVMSREDKLLFLERAREQGYFIRGYYIFTRSPIFNVIRVQSRVNAGGHDVPTKKIVERYWRSRRLLPRLYRDCDILHIYDNTSNNGAIRIIRKHKNSLTVYPNRHWSEEDLRKLIGLSFQ